MQLQQIWLFHENYLMLPSAEGNFIFNRWGDHQINAEQ